MFWACSNSTARWRWLRALAAACVDIDHDAAEETASSLDGHTLAVEADVTDEGQVRRMVAGTVAELGGLDAAFANAGIGGDTEQVFPETTLENWNSVMGVNLTGVWLTAREAAKAMIDSGGGGKIVATASPSTASSAASPPAQGHITPPRAGW